MMEVPTSLVNLVGESPSLDKAIEKIILHPDNISENLQLLAQHMKVRVKFKEPVNIVVKGNYKTVTDHVFSDFFIGNRSGSLCYLGKRGGRTGYPFPPLYKVESYEPALKSKNSIEFKSFEQFKNKFDTRFITEQEIEQLWNSKSAQHGGRYNKKDFRRLSKTGQRVMKEFLVNFKSINDGGGPGYVQVKWDDGTKYDILRSSYRTYHHLGRDIKISHQTNLPRVSYSSEYAGCLNGTYGLIANEKHYLWLEND